MKTIHTKKSPLVLNVILLNNADSFFTAIWCYPSPFGIIERMVFFHDLSCVLKCGQDVYSFL